ncbi:unnamed protein product [Parnassius mnemosyne]|uniref:Uncharacterized protein n=1 Tax=Parnassius mnemosyne TaxID=213953 RepID=A0AAV1LFP9_9NEOP
MIIKFIAFVTVISQVNSQFYQVTRPCLQGGMSKSNPAFAVSPTFVKAQKQPQQMLANSNVIFSNQPFLQISPIEYTITSPTSLLQSLPLPIATPAPKPCCPLSPSIEVCLPEVEPVFDFTLGCLDPILKYYSTINEVPIPHIPPCGSINPFLPAASPVTPVSTALPSECSCHFLKKISIPPPFI